MRTEMTKIQVLSRLELASQLVIIGSVYTIAFKVHTLLAGLTLGAHITYEVVGWLVRKEMVEQMNQAKLDYMQKTQSGSQISGNA